MQPEVTQPVRAVRIPGRGPESLQAGVGRAGQASGRGRSDGWGGSRYMGKRVELERVDE